MVGTEAADGAAGSHRASPGSFGIGSLFDQIRDAIIVSDVDGHVVLWNPAAEQIFGYQADEALGRKVSELIVPERLRPRHDAGMEQFRRTRRGQFIGARLPLELPALRADGSEITVELTLSRLDQHETYVLAIVRDVTDRMRLRTAVEEERNLLRAANESLEAFAYVVSHDLKEPVRGVGALLEFMKHEPDPAERAELLERALSENRRMDHLLRGLLDWSRAALAPVDRQPVEVGDVLRDSDCTIQFENLLRERGARVELAPQLPRVLGTSALLCQLFGNLITNAVRHNPSPTPRVWIRPGDAPLDEDGKVEVFVEDNGPGFPPAILDRVHRLRNRPSTVRGGFGLAIARRAAERLGGTLTLANRPSGGASVRVRLERAL